MIINIEVVEKKNEYLVKRTKKKEENWLITPEKLAE